jgi:hypothetical protein
MYQEVDTRGYHEMPWVYQVSEHVLLELTSIAITNSPVSVGFFVLHHFQKHVCTMSQTAWLVESLLRSEIAVGFNSDQHTRVAIAYDETHLLCVDRCDFRKDA